MTKDIWIFLFGLGLVLFSWPIISMFGHNVGIYFFSAWILYIVIVTIATLRLKKGDRE